MHRYSSHSLSTRSLALIALVAFLAICAWTTSLLLQSSASGDSGGQETPTPTKTPAFARSSGDDAEGMVVAPLPTFTPHPTTVAGQEATKPAPASTDTADVQKGYPALWIQDLAESRGLNPAGPYIVVDQNNQAMHIVAEGELVRILDVTTGDPGNGWDTPAWFGVIGEYWGTFKGRGGVMADEGWWLFERGGNFLIHGLPYVLDKSGTRHYKGVDDLGVSPASSGCIRLAPDDAEWFSDWNPYGVPIVILPYSDPKKAEG